jgi:hypothetical protein
MKKKVVKECRQILDTAEEIADEYFDTKNQMVKRIAVLSIANMLVELGKEE